MIELFRQARDIQTFIEAQGWHACFIGGLALQHWGEPRATRDIDLSLFTGFGGEAQFVDRLLESFPARVDGARRFEAFANRLQDRADILAIARRRGPELDWSAIRDRLEPLAVLKDEPEIMESVALLERELGR